MDHDSYQTVDLGEIKVSDKRSDVFCVPNVGTSVALIIYDQFAGVGGLAHIVLPESSLSPTPNEKTPGKFADTAVPLLVDEFQKAGGQKRAAVVKMVGGAQLFNFGGGSGNLLNIGARNATAIRAAMSKQGLAIERADTGGNKGKIVRFSLAMGEIEVEPIGGTAYII